jgi:hypothetical protein
MRAFSARRLRRGNFRISREAACTKVSRAMRRAYREVFSIAFRVFTAREMKNFRLRKKNFVDGL